MSGKRRSSTIDCLCCLKNIVMEIFILFNILFVKGNPKNSSVIYILLATGLNDPYQEIPMEQKPFIDRKCAYQNCFLCDTPYFFEDVRDFDVVVYSAPSIRRHMSNQREVNHPGSRSLKQKYVLYSLEASGNYPITTAYDGFFNWTWTYKFNSDIIAPYIAVRTRRGKLIGPGPEINWKKPKDMKPTSKRIINKLQNKKIAAAWFVSHCDAQSLRLEYVKKLNVYLGLYGHKVDIYGSCGNMSCPLGWIQECYALIETDYYFYLSFENSFCVDYVTEKLLHAVEHFAVPVVLGGADYNRFMPDGSYLNANKYEPWELAREMYNIIMNKTRYYDFFKWRRYYTVHDSDESPETDVLCRFCDFLNKNIKLNTTSQYPDIVRWFNEPRNWPQRKTYKVQPEESNFVVKFFSDIFNYFNES